MDLLRGTLAPEAMPQPELVDHLPLFFDEIIALLREDQGLASPAQLPEESQTAAVHGRQRLRLGFSVDAVVREYGALRNAIVAVAASADYTLSVRELQIVFEGVITGVAQAVSEYARQRDAELQRQANEHYAFIAHELRNPLSTVMMALKTLQHRKQVPVEGRQVEAMVRGLSRMHDLLDHTLKIARIGSGIELRREWGGLRALLADAEHGAGADAEDRSVTLRLKLEEDPQVFLDRRLFASAVGNLVRNAVKYSQPGSEVELRASLSSGRATIEVEDCCGGLPPGKVEEAFAPFVRLTEKETGFGLGLAIAKQAADAHGGSLRIQNLPGKGCIFVLEIPASEEAQLPS